MDDMCYLCRKHHYNRNHECPGCGAIEPGFMVFRDKKDNEPALEIIQKPNPDYGYHKTKIVKGVLGEASKITEEYSEFLDANEQQNSVMELVELSDLIGAIDAYVQKKYLIDIDTVLIMTRATQRAFKLGQRK